MAKKKTVSVGYQILDDLQKNTELIGKTQKTTNGYGYSILSQLEKETEELAARSRALDILDEQRREREEQKAAVKNRKSFGELLMGSGKDYQDSMGQINQAGKIATKSLLGSLFGEKGGAGSEGSAKSRDERSLGTSMPEERASLSQQMMDLANAKVANEYAGMGKEVREPAAEKDPEAEYFTGLLAKNSWAQESSDSAVPIRGMGRYSSSNPSSKEKRIEITDLESAKDEREAAYLEYQKAEENYYAVPDGDFQKAQDNYLAADARLQEAESRVKQLEQDLQAQEDEYTYNKYKAMIASLSEKEFEALLASNDQDDTMSYGYLLKQGYSRYDINAMYETLLRGLNAEMSENVLGSVYDFAGQNFGTGAVGFAGARAGQFLGGFTGTAQVILDTARHYFQGSPYHGTDPNGPGYLPSRAAAAADQGASDAIEGEDGNFLRKAAAFVYRGAANAADNLVRMAIASAVGGGSLYGAKINSAFSFTQGFQGSYRESQEKAGSPIQGWLVGSVDGGMEVFTESRTFERWMNLKDPELIGKDAYAWLKSAAVGIGNEITEEEASYIANTIADAVVMANKSDSAQFIKAAVADGKTQAEAWWELVKKYGHEMAVTAADTAMSTLLMNAGTGAVAKYQDNRLYKKNYGEVAQELVQEGLESPDGTQSRNLAEKYQKKLDAGKQLSGSELRRLVNANEEQFSREEQASDENKQENEDPNQEYIRNATTPNEEDYRYIPDKNVQEELVDSEMETTRSEPEKSVTLESLSEKYGNYAEAMRRNYLEGQDAEEYDREFQIAYDFGKSGLNKDALSRVEALSGLSLSQREIAYEIGKAAAAAQAKAQSAKNAEAANGKTGWHKGTVRGEGVKIADLTKEFNDPQRKAYSTLSTIAEATGIDIVLYKSQADENGVFQGEQGRFKWSDNTIYIDVNAGLSTAKDVGSLAKYTMLRTYGHEFTHFIEKWNPEQYNDFRKAVFETMENPEDLIETVLSQDSTGKMSYDDASREVVAEAMTDILEDSQFIQQLADKHTSVFETLRSKLKEFVENLKSYFKSLAKNGSREARLLKQEVGDSISYLENIVKQFDDIAVQAVENYQKTVAEDNSETSSETKNSEKDTKDDSAQKSEAPIESNQAENDSIQEKEEKEEPKAEEKQEPETTSYGSFSITPNTERGTLEIRFDSKPDQNVLNLLKENKFRWSSKNRLWYGKADQKEISKRISDAMNDAENSSSQEPVSENNQLLDNPAVNNTEEVTPNAETDVRGQEESNGALREDHQGGIPESEQPGEGNPRLLDEVEAEPLQQHEQGGTAGVPGERGAEAGRSGGGSDSERDGRSGSAGSGSGSDLRRDGDVTRDDGGISETVQREIERKSTEKPKGENYAIGESLNLAKGEKGRYRDNVSALRLIHQLNQEGRFATKEEQEVLSRYVGWGGLDGAFGALAYNRETRKSEMRAKSGWEKEFQELRQLVADGIITEEEYRGMSESTKNAHYTSMEVISAMYDGLKKLGFQGGRMLEPSSGVGNFVGGMPADMTASVKSWTMVELDRVTGQIAKYLYPNNDVRIEGFQDANIPNDYMDVAIGNVPFGNYGVVDRTYPKRVTKSIHNYFFAKSMDKVRPGGLVMFITSSFTMNSQDNAIRQYLMDRADLLGAIRLPNTAFKGNAGTDVVTDILILKKRIPGTAYSGETFLEAPQKSIPGSWRMANVNEYFSNHPEMVLGKETVTRGMYGAETLTYAPLEGAGSLGDQIRSAFDKITGKMDYIQKTAESVQKAAEKAVRKPKEGVYRRAQDGTITNGSGVAVTNADTAKRIGGMIDIRDAYRNLVERIQQGRTKEEIAKARKYLNQVYDSFVKENGLINDPKNKKAFEEDPYRFSLYALETDYQKGGKGKPSTAKKADIFTKDTIKANVTVTHAESVSDGLIVSINTTGGVDASLIARLTGRSKEEVTRELIDGRMAFKVRSGRLEAPETYLSGNVRAKLREAEALARNDKDFQNNVEELRRVIPKDVPYDEIHVSPGAVWVPTDVYADFIAHMLGGRNNGYSGPDVEVGYSAQTGEYKIRLNNARLKGNYHNTQEWGTSRRNFLDLFESLLGNGNVTVTDREIDANGKERRVVNKDETAAAQEKADKIKEEFRNWIWSDETRRTELSKLYNETYNALANPKYDGSSLTVNGLNATFSLREHQANAVKRIIASGGNTLLAHRVGAGKTLEMAAAAMKLRELGIVKKPVFAVPKSLVAQWGVEFNSYFPAAKLLVADDKSFSKENRKVFTNNIANGDFDAVILSYEQFGKIPMSREYQQRFLQEQIDEVLTAIAEEKAENGGKSLTVKQMEKKVAQLKTKLERLKIQSVDEDNVDFETLGIDALFVDEAHNFKNLQYTTKMQNVGGLGNSDGSQRAFDLYTKIRYLQQLNGGRGIVFATATPVMNSMAEMYIMQKYLQSDMLKQLGITTFDAWAKQFGEVVNTYEIKPSGQGVRAKQVFSNFKNLNELQLMFRSFSDVLTEVPGLKIPKMRGGGVQIVECEPGKFQKEYMKSLEKRANNVKNVDPSEDNMLKITSDGRKVSYTQRMIDPTLPYEPGCKLYRCCENILKEYRDGKNIKTVDGKTGKTVTINGTQIVFCDMATPKGKDKSKANDDVTTEIDDSFDAESARLYEDMRDYLAKKGIPRKEIAFIHEADTDLKRKQLFADMNAGKVRVLIGSTGKMGVGMNAQRCVTAIHHLDAPWRPGDVEQRDGRAFRQGNLNDEVAKYVYVTTGSFDARLWDILDRKSGFINQIMNGDDVGRNAEDTGDVTLSAAEVKALASGNPMIKESVELADELQKLNSLKRAHDSAVIRARTNLQNDIKAIAALEMSIEARKADLKKRTDTYSEEKFSMQIGGKTFSDRKDAGEALLSAILSKAKTENEYAEIGSFAGFQILAAKSQGEYEGVLRGSFRYGFKVHINNPTLMTGQMAKKIAGLEMELKAQEERLAQTITDKAAQEKLIAQPFERQAELDEKRRRYDYVMSELNKTEQQFSSDDEKVQYQLRENENPTFTLRDLDIDRHFIQHENISERNNAENQTVNSLIQSGKITVIDESVASSFISTTDWTKKADARNCIRAILKKFVGNDVQFSYHGQTAVAYLTNRGIDHAVSGANTKGKALALDSFYEMIRNAEYSYSGKGDHGNVGGRVDWDYFVSVARIGTTDIPMVFAIRTIDTDSRSQIYSIATKESPTILRGDGTQNQSANAHPSYEDSSGSGYRLAYSSGGVNDEYSQNQKRTQTLTDRDVLSMAADKVLSGDAISMDAAVSDALGIFKKRLSTLDELQEKRRELGKTYRELQFGANVDREKAAETLKQMREMDAKIQEAENKVIAAETAPALRKVLPVARRIVEQNQKALDDAVLQRWRDRRDNAAAIKKYRTRITKDVADMSSWILSPSNKTDMKHVPEVLKNTVIQFLSGIDFTSKRNLNGGKATIADQEFMKRISALKKAMTQNINENGLYSGYNDLPPNFMENLDSFIASAQAIVNQSSGESVINRMTSQELKSLSEIVTALKKLIQNFNKFHANAVYQHVYDAGDATIGELSKYQDAKSRTKMGESMNNFIFWNQIRPAYAFERFGPGGKAIYDGLRRGQAQLAFDTREIVSFTEKAYTEEEVKAWDKEVKTIQLEDGEVKLRVSQMMSFYELLKRDQAKGHIFGQGIRAATFTSNHKKVSDTGHTITPEDANRIISSLTPRQIAVADSLQKFMQEKGGSWGNYVSVKRFGENLFGEENYFPINSDGRHLEANADEKIEGQSLYALLNMGFTKKLQENANNRIVLYSIFDVFSNHMAGMAQYHSMALPVLDALKWFNYQQKETVTVIENGKERVINQVVDSVRDQLDRVYGVPEETRPGSGKRGYAENFITGILKAFNGTETQGISSDEVGLNSLRRYNMAQVAYNFRVVIQQPLAITRAGMIIDYASIIRGLRLSPKAIQKNIDEMQRYSGIAAWKDLGFYDTNISRGLTDIIKHSKTGMEKFREFGMIGAEKADQLTWAAMWSACKEEVQRKYQIQPGSEHFFEAVTSLFEEVIYKTQVVDSVLTKNEYLRSKGLFARATGSFMSEPTTTASMLADAFDKYRMDLQSGMSMRQAWEKNNRNIGRTALVYGVGVILLSAVQAIADAFRDDDKYEKYKDKWMEAFIGNFIDELLPFNKLPLVSDFYDLSKQLLSAVGVDTYGFNPSSIWMQWYDNLVNGTEIIYKKITNDEKNRYTWYGGIYKLLQAASGMTGAPMAAITREAVTGWNAIVGQMAPSLYVRSYEQKPETEIKYSFLDGKMSAEEAKQALDQYAGFTTENAKKKVDVLSFQRENPMYSEASETSIEKYLEFGAPKKIKPDVFFDVWAFENDAVADRDKDGKPINGSKRDKVCDYIDKQVLTKQQKDALYLAFGYSEKNLKDTPWH
jgi:N12 class adenine-specific DNA methylase